MNTSLPPAPLLLFYSDRGVLCPYSVINTGCPPSDLKELIKPPNPLPSGPFRQPTGIQAQTRAPQRPQLDSQPRPQLQPLLSGGSQPFTPVYSQAVQPSTSSIPPQSVGSQLPITMSGASRLGPSPLTMGGSTLGGNKLGSTTATQPSFNQFSVGALTSGQPLGAPPPPFSTAPRPLLGPQQQTFPGMTGPAAFLLGSRAPLQRPSGPPQSGTARGIPVTSVQASPPYVASTSVPQSQSTAQPPASQSPPNVSLPKTMQLPPAVNTLNQSIQLGQLRMPPLYSSTPVAPMPMGGKPPAVTSGLQPQHQSQPRPLLSSVMPSPAQAGATRFPPTQPGATRLPAPAMVPPLTQPGAAMPAVHSVVPQLTQPGATRSPLTQPPPPFTVHPPTQTGATRLPPTYQPAVPPVSASKQLSPKPPPKMTAQDDAEVCDY